MTTELFYLALTAGLVLILWATSRGGEAFLLEHCRRHRLSYGSTGVPRVGLPRATSAP